ncbi:MAG: phosphatase PAP2 family protein [Coriobacteriales bacterium]|nr:phosphatase PAP2 family protein [Coriobacteriales bacterium]
MGIEDSILLFFQAIRITPIVQICALISSFANNGFIWVVLAIILLLAKRYRKQAVFLLLALIVSYILFILILSNIVARPRPFDAIVGLSSYVGTAHNGYSFPSFHVISSFLFSVFVYLCVNKRFGFITFIIAIVISFTRMYLGVSYPTDILISIAIGFGVAFLVHFVCNRVFSSVEIGSGVAKRKSISSHKAEHRINKTKHIKDISERHINNNNLHEKNSLRK